MGDFEVHLTKRGVHWRKLGALVSPDAESNTLIVDAIADGLISDWNTQTTCPSYRVSIGDAIVSVNGGDESVDAMLRALQIQGQGDHFTLLIRPAACRGNPRLQRV